MKKPTQTPPAGIHASAAGGVSTDALLAGTAADATGITETAGEAAAARAEGVTEKPVTDEMAAEISATAAQAASRENAPLKETPVHADRELVQERADPSYGRGGEPTSAELRREPVPTGGVVYAGERIINRLAEQAAFGAYAGTLPATERVMPNGRAVPITSKEVDTEEREFTAAIRTMRNRKLYEIGAPVPLTRSQFEEKRRNGAVVEKLFDLGKRLTLD